jgi:dTDP-4-dehydrorhamnose reductase
MAKMKLGYKTKILRLITTSEHPTVIVRPMYSVVSSYKIAKKFNLNIPMWQYMLNLHQSDLR